jgi:hypothetical protein
MNYSVLKFIQLTCSSIKKLFLELSVGMQTDGIEVASVGNTITLHESCLVEAFNLKAAIQFNFKNSKSNEFQFHRNI